MSNSVKNKVVIHGPPTIDESFVYAMFGTDIRGLATKIRQGEYDHIIKRERADHGQQRQNN